MDLINTVHGRATATTQAAGRSCMERDPSMAARAHPSLGSGGAPVPFTAIEMMKEEEEEGRDQPTSSTPPSLSDYDRGLISALPVTGAPLPVRNYRGCWWPEPELPGLIAIQRGFRPRPGDLFLCTYPKSGTTWIKALAFATMTRAHHRHPFPDHPLLRLNPHDCVAHMDEIFALGQASRIEALPSPRILSTHMPFSLLPDSMTRASPPGCRFIYVCRDPKDVLVSFFHFIKQRVPNAAEMTFGGHYDAFCEGTSAFGPIWEHVLGYWKASLSRPQEVLFFKYEEMRKDPAAAVKRLAEFVGCPLSAEEEKGGVVEEIISLCSFEKLKSQEVNKTGSQHMLPNAAFFRKGDTGDWKNHMTPEAAKRFDEIVLQKIEGSGLTLPGVGCSESY